MFYVGHHLIRQHPVAVCVVEVMPTLLEEDAQRFRRGLAQQEGIVIAAADVRKAAHMAEHLAEQVRPLPGRSEGTNAAAADPASAGAAVDTSAACRRSDDRRGFGGVRRHLAGAGGEAR